MRPWAEKSIVINAIQKQNKKFNDLTQHEAENLNNNWHKDIKTPDRTFIKSVLANKLSQYLKFILDRSKGLYTYIVVTDKNGLSAGQTASTPDYWYGTNEAWRNTFGKQSHGVYVSQVDFSNITQMFQSDIAFTITQGDEIIGSIIVGVDVERLDE
jgi:C4-dicarboxylate-specific signal transduction histidine kinase